MSRFLWAADAVHNSPCISCTIEEKSLLTPHCYVSIETLEACKAITLYERGRIEHLGKSQAPSQRGQEQCLVSCLQQARHHRPCMKP